MAWAQAFAPESAGAVVAAPAPAVLGRDCDDTFTDDAFFPMLVSTSAGAALAAALSAGPVNVTLNYTCEVGTWVAIGVDGALAPMGWRKYTEAGALRWGVDWLLHLAGVQASVHAAAEVLELVPQNSSSTYTGTYNVTFPSALALRAAAPGAQLDFSLGCPGVGDNDCGPWCAPPAVAAAAAAAARVATDFACPRRDRIVTAAASCWSAQSDGVGVPPPPLEVGRWITPFRRASGRWLTPADALVALIGNGSVVEDGPWTCAISLTSCCEPWMVGLDLVLYSSRLGETGAARGALGAPAGARTNGGAGGGGGSAPFAAIQLTFPNSATHFGPGYNLNRTMLFVPPGAPFGRVMLTALISGHGSDPPPPVGQVCVRPVLHTGALEVVRVVCAKKKDACGRCCICACLCVCACFCPCVTVCMPGRGTP